MIASGVFASGAKLPFVRIRRLPVISDSRPLLQTRAYM